jgi:YbbR domain-containing protein
MLRWLGRNLGTVLLAFALAVAVWITAVTSANPDETQAYPNPVTIEYIGLDPNLIKTGTVPQQVQITLRAPRSIWNALTAGEVPVRAVVDLTGLQPGAHKVSVQTQVATRPVRILSVSPSSFNLVLESLVKIKFPVELSVSGSPAIGYQAGDPTIDPAEVTISGPESIVAQVKHVQAAIDMTNARQSVDVTVPLNLVTDNASVLSRITIHPSSTHIVLPVTPLGGYRDLAVKVVTVGKLASGYRLNNVTATPLIVTVYSANSTLIESLPGFVETTTLDLSGAKSNIDTKLSLNLPGGVTLIGDQTVSVQIEIVPIEGSLTVSFRPVEVIGLAQGFHATLSPITVDVILSGPLPELDSLNPSEVSIQVDLTGLTAGTYQLIPKVTVSKPGVTVQSILPGTVEVIIAKGNASPTTAPTPSPTPN